ncbi:hypothetical protein FF098_004990 [Parvularcula flava]|uniref:Antibiotic biosynthesis monooxygenase n=1 Tax=Aquisalinus luteolus TaxID=1566827 RepID=A0A8J3A2D5_9PROT|nr:antibiotic biosynthesis monooxygenase [Aquisalinus luteolus]NHK27252.1 hypothetical protein [Aquisalinus luteolus]GGH94872.1 hypothetical protein GCM10011355_10080 [Aquisalinus luteolus]
MSLAVLYQWKVDPDRIADFRLAWRELTKGFIEECGGLGSRLHHTKDGWWAAYARWPDEETRDKARLSEAYVDASNVMKDVVLERRPEITMIVTDDLLTERHGVE